MESKVALLTSLCVSFFAAITPSLNAANSGVATMTSKSKTASTSSTVASTSSTVATQLVTYPAGDGVETLDDFTVEVRASGSNDEWQPVAVYPVRVDEVRGVAHHVEVASMAYFDFEGAVEVAVTYNRGDVDNVRIRPLSYGITASAEKTFSFTLTQPMNLSVEVNGDIFHNLHLFANGLDANRPSNKTLRQWMKAQNGKSAGKQLKQGNVKARRGSVADLQGRQGEQKNRQGTQWSQTDLALPQGGTSNLVYFAPGVHYLDGDTLRLYSNQTVYVDGGARVYGTLIADSVNNVKIYGRGEIHPSGRGEGIYLKHSTNIEVDGVIVTQAPVGNCDTVLMTNVKTISYYGWGDGLNVFASNNITYNRVFCRNSDDCSTIYATRKGFVGGCRNIVMKNATLWADVAHPIMIGLHGNANPVATNGDDSSANYDTIEDVLYQNVDILDHQERQLDYQGCMAICCGDNNLVRNLTFENIRVEDFRCGQLVNVRIVYNKKYCNAPGRGIDNVLFKNVTYTGEHSELSVISGYDATRKVSNVKFENLVINGEKISDDMPGKPKWYKTGDMGRIYIGEHVENVIFE